MDEKEKTAQPVPYVVFEGEMTRRERTERRLWIVIILQIVIMSLMVAFYVWHESQYTDEIITQEVTQDADNGTNQFVGGDYYGSTDH